MPNLSMSISVAFGRNGESPIKGIDTQFLFLYIIVQVSRNGEKPDKGH